MATLVNFSIHLFTISIFIIILPALPTSNGSDDIYENCSSLISCGRLQNVGYPFWGLGRASYCGHPALQLYCPRNNSNEYPFRVYEEIFQPSESVVSLSLFYSCSEKYMLDGYHGSITCSDENQNITAYYLPNADNNQFKLCESINVPVFKKELNHFNQGDTNFSNVLKQGYEVDYLYSSACFTCQDYGGICGSANAKEFACSRKNHKSGQWKLIVGLAIPGTLFMLIALNIGLCCCMKPKFHSPMLLPKRLHSIPMNSEVENGSSFHGIPIFSYNELQKATNNFDVTRELGHGGFGIVYHGKLRDGTEVAVKRLHEKNYKQIGKFIDEIKIFTHLKHTNLVKLYGCTTRRSKELLLVYGFVPNGTVADHLYGTRKGSGTFSWEMRIKIATETASALSYLHASDIIHRDVKSNNILLDNHFSAKVADLGLARLFPYDTTHVSTAPQGTPGYLDPDYNKCYQLTDKSDVYSFGVVLVELISSLPAVDINRQDEINLSDYAINRIQHGALNELVDQKLGFETNSKVKRMITLVAELAFQCLQQDKELRPSMDEVLQVLKQIESMDRESLKGEYMAQRIKTSKLLSNPGGNDSDPTPMYAKRSPSPNSVIENWNSRSSASSSA